MKPTKTALESNRELHARERRFGIAVEPFYRHGKRAVDVLLALSRHAVPRAGLLKGLRRAMVRHPTVGRMVLYAIPDAQWSVNVLGIGPMKFRLRSNRGYWLRDPLYHESFTLGAMQRFIRCDDVVFDAGANIGLYVRFMIQRFGARRVIAFEPSSRNQALLHENIRLGNCQNSVQVMAMALADYDGIDEFQTDDISTASGTLDVVTRGRPCQAREQYGLPPATERVTVARIDTLVRSGAIPAPDVIKIDVEGAEGLLLRGASWTLQNHSPKLAIELHGTEESRAVVRFLLDAGYSVFGFLNTDSGTTYKEIVASDIAEITHQYSLYQCVASRDRELLKSPISFKQ